MSFGLPVFTNKVFFLFHILYIRLMEEILHQEMVSFPYQLVLAGFLPSKKQLLALNPINLEVVNAANSNTSSFEAGFDGFLKEDQSFRM